MHQSQVVLKEKNFEYFIMYLHVYGFNLGPPGTMAIWETGALI